MPKDQETVSEFKAISPVEFTALHSGQNPNQIRIRVERRGDAGIYHEVAIRGLKLGKAMADVLVGLNEKGELRVLVTSDGDGDGDHAIAVYPERPRGQMVEDFN